ncbi:hypothetical protein SteCoe_10160 [Stentor coeruleus]|uniref:Kinesin-like protein n=1 Tax=Stentor coeruleus TaxID=5963 RepID=A0A1R2CG75_9CILI|nr:hypothetical protein SteCoe_10160 [Stentor coeruleus]
MSRSENIHVSLRFRPLSYKEVEENESMIWSVSPTTVSLKSEWAQYLLDYKRLNRAPRAYNYNHCFSSKDQNHKVYETVAKRVVLASLDGYNGTLFVYGQTGSGKTYTMMGSESFSEETFRKKSNITPIIGRTGRSVSPMIRTHSFTPSIESKKDKGLLIFALEDLFTHIKNATDRNYCLSCSYLEIYNEQVYDLLEFNNDVLSVNEDPHKGFYVRGASEHVVGSLEEILKFIEKGEANRKYAATAMNHHSSRSHTIFKLNVTSVQIENNESNSITTESMLNFVDLAGSERVSSLNPDISFEAKHKQNKSKENLETLLNEGKHINTSLFYLCQVINKLSEKTSNSSDSHIPYRNSNLTKILRSSLGGNSLTCIICTAVPTLTQFEMSLSTLRFGGIAKTITNNVEANVKNNNNTELLQGYQKDLETLRKELENAQQGGKAKVEEALGVRKKLEERIARLTQMLFNQSRQNNMPKSFDENSQSLRGNFWCSGAGDLIVDTKFINEGEKLSCAPKFDQKGILALERMKTMHLDLKKKEQEISELKECKQSLLDSKINLKNDLKQALNLCQQLSSCKQKYKDKCKKLNEKAKVFQSRLAIVERHSGLSKLNDEQLQELENFFFYSLDAVKNAKFRKKYESKLNQIQHDTIYFKSPVSNKSNKQLWGILGLHDDISLTSSDSESSIDFEASFYKNNKPDKDCYNSFVSNDISTLIYENLENEDTKRNYIKNTFVPETNNPSLPLTDIPNTLFNSKRN